MTFSCVERLDFRNVGVDSVGKIASCTGIPIRDLFPEELEGLSLGKKRQIERACDPALILAQRQQLQMPASVEVDAKDAEDGIRRGIEKALMTLSFREREIVKLRYGIGYGRTYSLSEVGRILKVTRERVRQVEAKAIRKLQHPTRAKIFDHLL